MAKQTTGEFLATLRKANGFTQQEVAEKLSISDRTLSSWETNRTAPDLLLLPALADMYNVTVDEILRGERRQPTQSAETGLSDKAQKNLRKNSYAKFLNKRILCLGLGLTGGVIFLLGGALLLYTGCPVALDVTLAVAGVLLSAICAICIIYFEHSLRQSDGLVLDEDYTDDKKAFALTVHRKAISTLLFVSLPYILGAIAFLMFIGLNSYSVITGDIEVQVDRTTPTVVWVCISAAIGLALVVCSLVSNLTGIKKLGNSEQKSCSAHNLKLLGKLCAFSAIPVAIALALLVIFSCTPIGDFEKTATKFFTVRSEQEVYQAFQTLELNVDTELESENGTDECTVIPVGKYFLNFQSENYVTCIDGDGVSAVNLTDLGNGFYGTCEFYGYKDDYPTVYDCRVYYIKTGVSPEDVRETDSIFDCFCFYGSYNAEIFETANGNSAVAVNIAYDGVRETDWWDYGNVGYAYSYRIKTEYDQKSGEWAYLLVYALNYAPLFLGLFIVVIAAVIICDSVIYFAKRKKIKYSF